MTPPWDFDHSVQASQNAADEQIRTEDEVKDAFKKAAQASRLYDVALARKMWELKREGIAVTVCERLARGDEEIAALRVARDEAEGFKESAKAAAWRANADRKDVEGLIDWSKRREIVEGYSPAREPATMRTFGARRAS